MLGSIMAANVLFVIIPGHWELVKAKKEGREPDPKSGLLGKQRSVHNSYLTLPVLFTMLAGHWSFTYTHDHAWAVLVALMVVGAVRPPLLHPPPRGRDAVVDSGRRAAAIAAIAVWLRPHSAAPATSGRPGRLVHAGGERRQGALRAMPLHAPDAARLQLLRRRTSCSTRRSRSTPCAAQIHARRRRVDVHAARQRDAHDPGRARSRSASGSPKVRRSSDAADHRRRLRARRPLEEDERSPRTVAFLRTMLPYDSKLIQARWSGQSAWIPMGDYDVGDLGPEDPTSYPAPGELLLYPGGVSEVEILFPYGDTCFASKAGQLAGQPLRHASSRATSTCRRSARPCSGRARRRSASKRARSARAQPRARRSRARCLPRRTARRASARRRRSGCARRASRSARLRPPARAASWPAPEVSSTAGRPRASISSRSTPCSPGSIAAGIVR